MQEAFELIGQAHIPAEFEKMGIVEEEIASAKARYPNQSEVINAMFTVCPSPVLHRKPISLFRIHVRQFLRNIATGIDPDRPTLMEVAIMCTIGSTYVGPVSTDLVLMFESDAETMEAFGMQAVPAPENIGNHYWPVLTQTLRKVYEGKTRATMVKECLKQWSRNV